MQCIFSPSSRHEEHGELQKQCCRCSSNGTELGLRLGLCKRKSKPTLQRSSWTAKAVANAYAGGRGCIYPATKNGKPCLLTLASKVMMTRPRTTTGPPSSQRPSPSNSLVCGSNPGLLNINKLRSTSKSAYCDGASSNFPVASLAYLPHISTQSDSVTSW